ncbi:hypothetical protein Pla163_27480 [Planctomycetes bacterium Pla163]|uniref:Uncharacterized protein n=1 Tax=Rohdeia mirabilis TaxID=2528008 RepID=A0A518D2B6_9BACT|nr:hypothetical protein Pla163_27480 [Planctomycetes bacterium Pla163]
MSSHRSSSRRACTAALAVAGLAFRRTARVAWLAIPAALVPRWVERDASVTDATLWGTGSMARSVGGAAFDASFAYATAFAALGVIALCAHAGRLREEEADGLAQTPVARGTTAFATWCGGGAALVLALLCASTAAWAGGARVGAEHVALRQITSAPLNLLGETDARSLSVAGEELRGATRLRARLVTLPDRGPVVYASFRVDRTRYEGAAVNGVALHDDPATRRTEGTVWANRTLEVDLPSGTGDVRVTLARLGTGAGLTLERDGLTALGPVRTGLDAELALAFAAASALLAAAALVLALRPYLSTAFSVAIAASIWLGALSGAPALAAWPGADLGRRLELVGTGVAPRLVDDPTTLAVAAAIVLVSLVVAARAPRTAREVGA